MVYFPAALPMASELWARLKLMRRSIYADTYELTTTPSRKSDDTDEDDDDVLALRTMMIR